MKNYIELSLVAILIALLYQPPTAITHFVKSGLGKSALLVLVVVISHLFGMNSGLLAAIIAVVLLNNVNENFEGMEGINEGYEESLDYESGDEESNDDESGDEESNDDDTDNKESGGADGDGSPKLTNKESFTNYTLDNAADYPGLKSSIIALDTNEKIKNSMRASEYAKTAPAGSAVMTNHMDTAAKINNNSPLLA